MSVRYLDRLFAPRSVALIGATDRTGSLGAVALRNLRRAGFRGELMLVNPHHAQIDGIPVYSDIASLPRTPDLALIATPPATLPGLVAQLGERGTRGAAVITAGFGELGPQGEALQRQMLDAARPYLLRIVGPNCVGVMVPRIGLDASFSHIPPRPGHLALISQSGAMVTALLDWASPRGIGFSHIASLGDMADVDFGDMLDYLAADAETRAILIYAEGITHSRKFMSAARAAARIKPVLVLKAGRSAHGARAASSHTGALAGADAVYDAAFRRAGMLRVGTMAALFQAAETLALTDAQLGDRLAILTNGGGAGVLAVDALAAAGGELAVLEPRTLDALNRVLPGTWSRANPIDIIGDASGERYSRALDAVLADRGVDAVLILNCPTALADPADAAKAVIATMAALPASHRLRRHVFAAWLGEQSAREARELLATAGIASYETPDDAVAGFMQRVEYRRNQTLLRATPPARPSGGPPEVEAVRTIITAALAGGASWLAPEDAVALLQAYGIPVADTRVAPSPEAAAELAREIGFPCALKIRSPDVVHKSDVGGVALGLTDAASVRAEAAAMAIRVETARPAARLDGYLVQAEIQRPEALELLAGIAHDPVFGPVIMFGHGGIAVEVMNDTALEFPPLDPLLARSQMARTRVWHLLQGYRGRPSANLEAIADVLIRLAQLALDHPEIREIDINPLLADADGVIAIDARIKVAPVATSVRPVIAPYPQELETTVLSRDGQPVRIRALRPEDEPLLHDLAARMDPEDLRLRFFTPIRGLSHAVAARLTQLDYDRELGLLAEENGAAMGVAHFFADPDNRSAEYAIAVRSDAKGRGIGYALMQRLCELAAQRGIGELVGEVLRENRRMLDMCHDLGFTCAAEPGECTSVRVRKRLSYIGFGR
ncbi:MAG: bifunctional acetate--CoA ligase family protein/GNAT family N-acetyltransferase [Alphaproteobacteria bacterium]|nr:bifunctional acetate--CoA ligase family protein/GNAT family N-acetyltransferase [Alphaproteobacteria bacterium]